MTYLTDLIEALRRELQQYGEMLARCDEAESHLTQNAAQAARTKLKALQEQEGVIERAQRRREQVQRRLARRLRVPEETGLAEIIPLLPRPHQLLVRALADENNRLSARLRQRAARKSKWSWDWLELMESPQLAAQAL